MKKLLLLITILLLVLLNSGCATYIKDRAVDFQDCFVLNVGVGPGLSATAKVTDIATVHAGWSDVDKAGMLGRYTGTWYECEAGIPFVAGGKGIWPTDPDYKTGKRIDRFYEEDVFITVAGHTVSNAPHDGTGYQLEPKPVSHWFDIEAGATLVYISFQTGFSMGEFVDFLLGWTTLDICQDDIATQKTKLQKSALKALQAKNISIDSKSFFDALRKEKKEEIKLFLLAGMNPNSIDDLGLSAISYPISWNDLDTVKCFFDHGADIEFIDETGRTPLVRALDFGCCFHPKGAKIDIVQYLLSKGAKVNIKCKPNGEIPLMKAVGYGQYDMTKLLLENGANPNVSDGTGRGTPLNWAIAGAPLDDEKTFDFLPIIKLLVKHGADINLAGNEEGFTPLHWACFHGEKKIAKFLIENGAKLDVKNNQGETAIDIARKKRYGEIAKLLAKPKGKK